MDSSILDAILDEPRAGATAHLRHASRLLLSLARPEPDGPILHEEQAWRRPDALRQGRQPDRHLVVSRWHGSELCEVTSENSGHHHMLAVTLRPSRFTVWLGAKAYADREVIPGTIQISPPAQQARVAYFRPYDVLHMHIPDALLMECHHWCHGKWPAQGIALRDPLFAHDPLLQELGSALLSVAGSGDAYASLLADFLNLAIVTRVFTRYGGDCGTKSRPINALPNWRLRRVTEFIEANLGSRVTLADLADAAGLSRMHFAAQFRAATGERPHEYVLRRRVEKAQELLATTDTPLAELALATGFSSQAHFAAVFKRFSGKTPRRWRQQYHL